MSKKHAFICTGGPFDGGTIHLSVDGDQKTAVFTAKGERGRYRGPSPKVDAAYRIARNRKPQEATWDAV